MNSLQVLVPKAPPLPETFFCTDAAQPQEALSFQLGGQEYGIPLRCVQEIRSYQAPTRLAGSCDALLGVIDLRGEIVPLFDLRRQFAMASAEFDARTVTIVVLLDGRCIGVVVDEVNDVIALTPEQIRPMPPMGGDGSPQELKAIGAVGERRLVLMDIEALLRVTALPNVSAHTSPTTALN